MIEDGSIPGEIFHQTDRALVLVDITPQAPTHLLVVPRTAFKDGLYGVSNATEAHESILGHLLVVAAEAAAKAGLEDGYRLVINEGKHGCQSVPHLHIHLLGGKQLGWPPTGN